jgi:hypothetical protein
MPCLTWILLLFVAVHSSRFDAICCSWVVPVFNCNPTVCMRASTLSFALSAPLLPPLSPFFGLPAVFLNRVWSKVHRGCRIKVSMLLQNFVPSRLHPSCFLDPLDTFVHRNLAHLIHPWHRHHTFHGMHAKPLAVLAGVISQALNHRFCGLLLLALPQHPSCLHGGQWNGRSLTATGLVARNKSVFVQIDSGSIHNFQSIEDF